MVQDAFHYPSRLSTFCSKYFRRLRTSLYEKRLTKPNNVRRSSFPLFQRRLSYARIFPDPPSIEKSRARARTKINLKPRESALIHNRFQIEPGSTAKPSILLYTA